MTIDRNYYNFYLYTTENLSLIDFSRSVLIRFKIVVFQLSIVALCVYSKLIHFLI